MKVTHLTMTCLSSMRSSKTFNTNRKDFFFINDLPHLVDSNVYLFADNTKIFNTISQRG